MSWVFNSVSFGEMEASPIQPSQSRDGMIREDVLLDQSHPLHCIAERLRPYLRVLQDQFHPEQVIVFGSYAYGKPDHASDVDLLVVKPIVQSRIKDKVAIRSAWWPLLRNDEPLSFDLMLADPAECDRIDDGKNSYLGEILERGLRVL